MSSPSASAASSSIPGGLIVPFTISPIDDPIPDPRTPSTVVILPGSRAVPISDFPKIIDRELDVSRLDIIHEYLWYAAPAGTDGMRSLHEHLHLNRTPQVIEQYDLHLVWNGNAIFIKPLPAWLLNAKFWRENLCSDPSLHRRACGLLWTYVKLIIHESDYNIAQEYKLLPAASGHLSYATLSTFLAEVQDAVENAHVHVDRRYLYGDLRLGSLNTIYRRALRQPGGFHSRGIDEDTTVKRTIAVLLSVFAFFSLTLTAMQVCLAVDKGKNGTVQLVFWGFALASLIGISAPVAGLSLLVLGLLPVIYFFSKRFSFFSSRDAWKRRNQSEGEPLVPHMTFFAFSTVWSKLFSYFTSRVGWNRRDQAEANQTVTMFSTSLDSRFPDALALECFDAVVMAEEKLVRRFFSRIGSFFWADDQQLVR